MPTPTDYTSGTLTLTNGSVNFTGTGTGWQAFAAGEGDFFAEIVGGEDFAPPIIATITSNTAGTLTRPWAGPTLTGVAYRMRHYWDSGRASAQSAQLREQLGNGNLVAFSALEGPGVPVFDGLHSIVIKPETDFINGVAYDVQVDDMAGRAAYDGQASGFAVLVSDVGNTFGLDNAGRSAVFSKRTNTVGDWSDPAFVTGPPGLTPNITADVTVLPSSGIADVIVTPISGGYDLDFLLPAADGFFWEGTYNSANAYPKDSVVRRNGTSFIAVQDAPIGEQPSAATPPVDTAFWEIVAAKGVDGAGTVTALNEGVGIDIDSTDPTLPIVKLQDMPTLTVKGRVAAGTGAPTDLTGSQVTTLLDVFNTTRKGVVPQPTSDDASAKKLLAADGTWIGVDQTNVSVLGMYQAKTYSTFRRGKNTLWDGVADENGINAGRSANMVRDAAGKFWTGVSSVGLVFLISGTSWVVPAGVTSIAVETLGAGGGGGGGQSGAASGAGGGGGAYSAITGLAVTPGASIAYVIGAAGAAGAVNTAGGTGGDTWFNGASLGASSVGAKGGTGGASNGGSPGTGGASASGVGTTKRSGGNGGAVAGSGGGTGGGGAAGTVGAGKDGGTIGGTSNGGSGGGGANNGTVGGSTSSATGATGGNNRNGIGGGAANTAGTDGGGGGGSTRGGPSPGGPGGNGTEWDASHGSGGGGGGGSSDAANLRSGGAGGQYGGGGGGGANAASSPTTGGAGGAGLIVISYMVPPANMKYSSRVETADSNVSSVIALFEIDQIDALTLGTDLTAIATCNNWTQNAACTLLNKGRGQWNGTAYRTLVEASASGLTAGTQFAVELIGANNKRFNIYGVEAKAT